MKLGLSVFALAVLASLIGVSIWATGHVSIVPAIQDLISFPSRDYNAWFVATLFDAYFGFVWFWLWIAYRETSWMARGLWLIAILLTGNMAMAVYVLIALAKLPPKATLEDLLLRPRT